MRNCINWDSEKIALIRQLYLDQGYSAGMIARELERLIGGCFTRNSVMGKIHRLGLHKDGIGKLPPVSLRIPDPNAVKAKRKRKWKPKAPPRPPHLIYNSPPTSGIACPCQIDELERFNCKWPIGDPIQYFCGAVVVPGKPYCPTHDALGHHAESGRRLSPARAARIASFQPSKVCRRFPVMIGDPLQAAFSGSRP